MRNGGALFTPAARAPCPCAVAAACPSLFQLPLRILQTYTIRQAATLYSDYFRPGLGWGHVPARKALALTHRPHRAHRRRLRDASGALTERVRQFVAALLATRDADACAACRGAGRSIFDCPRDERQFDLRGMQESSENSSSEPLAESEEHMLESVLKASDRQAKRAMLTSLMNQRLHFLFHPRS